MLISVIIPARNEERHIGRCLESLAAQNYPRDRFEVILVDNGSADRTVSIAHFFAAHLPLRILKRERVRISAVRNFGAGAAKGEFLAFLDADCEPPPGWLRAIESRCAAGAVYGARYLIPAESTWVARAWDAQERWKNDGTVPWLVGGDLVFHRSDFQRLGGFNEGLETNEDLELCSRARAAGIRIIADPELAVVHWGTPQTLGAFFRQQRWHGRSVLRVLLNDLSARQNLRPVLLAVYTAGCLAAAAPVAAICVYTRTVTPFLILIGALCVPPAVLAWWKAARLTPRPFFQLWALYLAFGIARALCLFRLGMDSEKTTRN